MLRTYIKTALRNLGRNKSYTIINITGLSVGIAAFLLIFLVIRFESSFDDFHKNRDRIYRVVTVFNNPDGEHYTRGSSFPTGQQLRLDYPQLEHVARINANEGSQVTVLDGKDGQAQKKFNEEGLFFAEPDFFEIFNFPWISGNPKSSLSDPFTAVLTQSTAEKYFGDWKSAVGKSIKLDNRKVCKITGIIKDPPHNTDFPLQVVISFRTTNMDTSSDWLSTYGDLNTFVVLPPELSPAKFNKELETFVKKHKPAEYAKDALELQALKDIHFDKRFGTYNHRTFSRELIKALGLIGLFLLLIACVNFINLATANAVTRAKEVGVRKVLGSRKHQLIFQFLNETFIIALGALALSLVIAYLILPLLNQLLDSHLQMQVDRTMMLFLVSIIVLVTLLSGFYPAIVLSGFNPITALKTKFSTKISGGISLRRALVVFQFVIAQVLIIGTLVIVGQMDYFKNKSMGFDKESIVNVQIPNDSISATKLDGLKNDLLQLSSIKSINYSTFSIADNDHWNSDFKFDHSAKRMEIDADLKWSDPDVFKTFNLKMVAGRPYYPSDTVREIVVNETMVHKLGIRDPKDILGKRIDFWDGQINAPIVGVVKDFNTNSLAKAINPVVMGPWKGVYQYMSVKFQPERLKETMSKIEARWNATFPDYNYRYQFFDEKIASFYKQESQLSSLYKIFAGIAIFISCLGLYGLISFMAMQRTKEVGIRKVLGASVLNIIYMFSKEFTILIAISFVIAAPIAWYFMNDWLNNFAFRINIGITVFLLTIVSSIAIAWITVGHRAVKAALANPVNSLRSE